MNARVQCIDVDKLLEAIVFVASEVREPTLHKISKMFWYADKLHLERYGFVLSADTYHALADGPVPSLIYDILKVAKGIKQFVPGVDTESVREALSVQADGRTVQSCRAPNTDYLSETELECLSDAIAAHGHKSFGTLSNETHDAAWSSVPRNAAIPLRAIVETLPNANEVTTLLYS